MLPPSLTSRPQSIADGRCANAVRATGADTHAQASAHLAAPMPVRAVAATNKDSVVRLPLPSWLRPAPVRLVPTLPPELFAQVVRQTEPDDRNTVRSLRSLSRCAKAITDSCAPEVVDEYLSGQARLYVQRGHGRRLPPQLRVRLSKVKTLHLAQVLLSKPGTKRHVQLQCLQRVHAASTSLLALDLVGNKLSSAELFAVLSSLHAAPRLLHLHIDDNRLAYFPPQLRHMRSLRCLSACNNKWFALPPQVGQLRALRQLHVHGNELQSISASIGQLQALQELHVSDNMLLHLPDALGSLPNLQTLGVADNFLRSLPDSLCLLPKLAVLDASDNMLHHLPEQLGAVRTLRSLSAAGNAIVALPHSLDELLRSEALQTLDLQENPLASLSSMALWFSTFSAAEVCLDDTPVARLQPWAPARSLYWVYQRAAHLPVLGHSAALLCQLLRLQPMLLLGCVGVGVAALLPPARAHELDDLF